MAKREEAETDAAVEIAVIFPTESVVKSLAKAKRSANQRSGAISGELGSAVKEAADKKHLDRKAFAIATSLDVLDDERLAITLPHLLHYIEVLGLDKRAAISPTMFEPKETGPSPTPNKRKPAGDKKSGNGAKAGAAAGDNVTSIGKVARTVAEKAGENVH